MHLDDRLNGQGPWSIVHIVPFALYECHLAKMAHSNSKFSLFGEGERAIIMSLNVGQLKEAHATQNIDKVRILNSIALSRLGTCDFELLQSYPAGDPHFQRVDEALASHFALSSWYGFVLQGRCTELLATAIKADVGRKIVQLSLTGCQNFSDHELDVLVQSLPAELRVLRLDLGFSGLETLDMFTSTVQCLKSLVQLKLRFTGSSHFRTAAGLGVALREMENLMYLELWCAEL